MGGFGAVLAITPPQITSTQSIDALSGPLPAATKAPSAVPTPKVASSSAAPTKTVKPSPAAPQSAAPAPGGFREQLPEHPLAHVTTELFQRR